MANRTLRKFDGPLSEYALKKPQFFVKKNKTKLIELCGAFEIGKICVGFRTYDANAQADKKTNGSIDFFLDIAEFELLCHNILSGNLTGKLNKGMQVDPFYKGSPRNGQNISRVMSFTKANMGIFITVHEGPGRLTQTGAMQPAYDLKGDDHVKISAMLTPEELKSFALQGGRACDFYYDHYFGREVPVEASGNDRGDGGVEF